jgi:predicted PurR-regulated permease PerM
MLKIELSYRGLLTLLGIALGLWVGLQLWPVLLLLLVSLIFMIGLLPYVEAMVRWGLPRPLAVVLILVGLLACVAVLVGLLVPAMLEEFRNVRDNLPESAREVEELLALIGIEVELQQRAREFEWNELFSGNEALDYGQQVLATTISLITIVAITAYLLADTPRLGAFVRQFIPPDKTEDAERLFLSLTSVVGGYLRGQLITSLAIGVFTFTLLSIVGVSNPLAFAVLAALADVVPLVGALIATGPPVAAALQESATRAAVVLIGMMAYQQFEDRVLVPRVYGRMLNLPPLIVLIAVLAGAELMGVTGVLLALPLAAAGRVAIDYVYRNQVGAQMGMKVEQTLAPDTPAPPKRRGVRVALPKRNKAPAKG